MLLTKFCVRRVIPETRQQCMVILQRAKSENDGSRFKVTAVGHLSEHLTCLNWCDLQAYEASSIIVLILWMKAQLRKEFTKRSSWVDHSQLSTGLLRAVLKLQEEIKASPPRMRVSPIPVFSPELIVPKTLFTNRQEKSIEKLKFDRIYTIIRSWRMRN